MKKSKENNTVHTEEKESVEGKPIEGRRRLVKKLATGGAIAAAVPVIPKQWAKPVTDSVLLPAHAQTSQAPALALTAEIELDNVDGATSGITRNPGTFVTTTGLTNFAPSGIDELRVNAIAMISPPQALNVTLNVTSNTFDLTGSLSQTVAADPITGQAVFAQLENTDGDVQSGAFDGVDSGLDNTVDSFTVTFDAPGTTQQSFTFNL